VWRLQGLFRPRIFPKDVVQVKEANQSNRSIGPSNAFPREGARVGNESFVKSSDLKQSSFQRNLAKLIFTSLTHPTGIQNIKKGCYGNHHLIMHQSDKICIPMHHFIVSKHMVSHKSIPIPWNAK